jgi:hypothetical protein
MWTLIAGLIPALTGPILNHLDRRLESAGQSEVRELERQKRIIEAQVALAANRERDFFGRFPAWLISTSVAVWIAAVLVDSAFPMEWLTPLALPSSFTPVVQTVIFALFGLGAVDKVFGKR